MRISIIHPSRNRPQQAYQTYLNWSRKCDDLSNIEYLLSLDVSDNGGIDYANTFEERNVKGHAVLRDNNSAIEAINNAAKVATGDLFIVVSDDTDCFQGWDTALLNELKGKEDFLVKCQDGIQPILITMPIMDRAYYNRFGYIYHPDYKHMACDVELTAVGLMLGRVINSNLLFEHLHYSTGKTPKDAINEKNDLTYAHGDMVLGEHLKNNFGIENPLIQYNEIKWH